MRTTVREFISEKNRLGEPVTRLDVYNYCMNMEWAKKRWPKRYERDAPIRHNVREICKQYYGPRTTI